MTALDAPPRPSDAAEQHSHRRSGGVLAPKVRQRRRLGAYLGLMPFAFYVVLFLALPTVLALATGFFDASGRFTFDNIAVLGDPVVLKTFASSFWISALTSVVGAVVGALICYALIGTRVGGTLRLMIESASSVLAQFGGVMLAFAFIATIGIQGLVTVSLKQLLGIDIFSDGVWLYQLPGLILPYIYFQVPLMVITFLPAIDGLKPQWAEANATLGGSRLTYWMRVGGPVLAPALFGSLLLLFANAFSAYATAAALISQGSQIVPLQIRGALVSETMLGRSNVAGALAVGMIVVMVIVMGAYTLLQRRTSRWQR
jgi:putative spermidine/putrescine transport system permease protein